MAGAREVELDFPADVTYRGVVGRLAGMPVPDVTSGFRAMSREAALRYCEARSMEQTHGFAAGTYP